ncbi:MAG: hypothetical protein ACTJLL_04170, partial [Anaplasma sp.]
MSKRSGKSERAFKIVVNATTKKSVKDSVCVEDLVLGHKGVLNGDALLKKWEGYEFDASGLNDKTLKDSVDGQEAGSLFRSPEISGLMSKMQTSEENTALQSVCTKLV